MCDYIFSLTHWGYPFSFVVLGLAAWKSVEIAFAVWRWATEVRVDRGE